MVPRYKADQQPIDTRGTNIIAAKIKGDDRKHERSACHPALVKSTTTKSKNENNLDLKLNFPTVHGIASATANKKSLLNESQQSIDNIVSKELLELSIDDRNAIDEEIHGVSTFSREETPEFLEKSLAELSAELEKIPDDDKAAYLQSQMQFSETTYVNQPNFRLRFLRCELFDAQRAAIRMVKFLDFSSFLFGPKVLERPIRISDLTREEEKYLRLGTMQVLPFRDRSGRAVYARVGGLGYNMINLMSHHRAGLYFAWAVSDDVDSQKTGVTKVLWAASDKSMNKRMDIPPFQVFEYSKKHADAVPFRVVAIHWCLADTFYWHILRSGHAMVMGKKSRARMKFHVGEEVELRYKLQSYGIPVDLIPVTGSGTIKTNNFKQWLRAREQIEGETEQSTAVRIAHDGNIDEDSGENPSAIIICPRSTDVVFRTGTTLTSHPGNSMFQGIIESRMQEHFFASHMEKTAIIKAIIQTVYEQGGRFLQWDNRGWWKEIEKDTQIHAKVATSVKGFKGKMVARRQTFHSCTDAFQNQDHRKRRRIDSSNDGGNSDTSCGDVASCFF